MYERGEEEGERARVHSLKLQPSLHCKLTQAALCSILISDSNSVLEESSTIRSQETSVKRTLAATDLAGPLGRLHGTLIRLEGTGCPDLAADQP